jgi:hypothetical protein
VRAADAYTAHVKIGELSAGAEVYDNALKCNRAFGENISRTFTPVQVVIENGHEDKFVVDRARATLGCDDGTTLAPVSSAAVYEEYRTDLLATGLFVGRHAAAYEASRNDAKGTAWAEGEFPAQVILTGRQRVGGFVYFRGKCAARARAIRLTAENLKTDEKVFLEVTLHEG